MKVGIVGAGAVGSACTLALVMRGCARNIVLVDRTRSRAKAVATDIRYGAPLSPLSNIDDGDYQDLAGASLIMITVGVNEKTGGATDRNDPSGRLKLLDTNAAIYKDVIPRIVQAAPDAVLLVVTDPPDPLADLARALAHHDRVLSTGTFLDSLRLRVHVAERLEVSPSSVEAQVLGEHGTSQVYLWSSARVAGVPLLDALAQRHVPVEEFRQSIQQEVRFANISIIEGNNASQFGIGMVSARMAEIVLRDERAVIPVGCFNQKYGATISLPSILGRGGVVQILEPEMSEDERSALRRSAETLKRAASRALA
ncbi:MAG: L-lactate dehydrogenase [Hyphomicrobiales bacterium]|jgi:L-lactate dehydrogenase